MLSATLDAITLIIYDIITPADADAGWLT